MPAITDLYELCFAKKKIIHENIVNHLDDGGMTFVERQNGNWQCEWRGCIEERERLTWYHIEAQNECSKLNA